MKQCTICKQSKPPEDFYKNKSRRDGLCNFCKNCSKEKGRKHTENGGGLKGKVNFDYATIYPTLYTKQNGVCAICGRPPKKKRLSLDHDHKTGEARGLLCFQCNFLLLPVIERFGHLISQAFDYLKGFHSD